MQKKDTRITKYTTIQDAKSTSTSWFDLFLFMNLFENAHNKDKSWMEDTKLTQHFYTDDNNTRNNRIIYSPLLPTATSEIFKSLNAANSKI